MLLLDDRKSVVVGYPWARLGKQNIWCSVCVKGNFKMRPCLASAPRRIRGWLKRHAASSMHQRALHNDFPDCPTKEGFETVFRTLKKGSCAGGDGLATVGGAVKVRQMIYCLGEATKRRSQAFLLRAKSITLIRDARKHRLCIRYVASRRGKGFSVQRGVLGWTTQKGLSGRCIARDTQRIINEFCSSYLQGPRPVRHRVLRQHIRDHVHQQVVDAAADELLAGELCRGNVGEDLGPILPNCRVLLRCKAHAARRPLNRPWTKLPVLSDVIQRCQAQVRVIHQANPTELLAHARLASHVCPDCKQAQR